MKLKCLIIIIASFISMVSFAQNTINEDFESGALHPLMTLDVVGSFSSAPGIKANDSFGSSEVFGFGKSNCSSSCFDSYKTTLTITFPSPTYVSTIKWKEMEIYGNWGSQGQVLLDDVVLSGAELGAQPVNSRTADASPRIINLIINQTVTTIKFVVNDITSSSEIIIDDLEIQTNNQLVGYEYWFNNDYENVHIQAIVPTYQHVLNADLDVSALPNNVNVLNIRYKDSNGKYSSTLSKLFVKLPEAATANASKLVFYEYWFNNDYENVQKTTITAAQQDFLQTDIDVSSLPNNVNVFNIRYKDESGLYSSTLSKLFVKLPKTHIVDNKLTEYTYWFDDDFENARTVKLAEEVKVYEWIETIDLPENMAGRDHAINIRFKDQQNVWSVPFEKTFYNKFSPRIEFEGYIDEICFGELIQITPISVDVDSIYWDFGDGSPVLLKNESQKVSHLYEAAGEYEIKVTYKHIATGDEFDTEDLVDSIALAFSVHPLPDNSVSIEENTLTANQVGATYQWLDCNDDFQAIANENGQIFSPTKDGNYAVEISMNGCTVTSSCYEMNLTAIDHLYNNGIHIYPNPTHGIFYIDFGKEAANCAYAISDVSGQILNITEHSNASVLKVDLSGFTAGVYFVAITEGGKTTVVKVVYTKIF